LKKIQEELAEEDDRIKNFSKEYKSDEEKSEAKKKEEKEKMAETRESKADQYREMAGLKSQDPIGNLEKAR
jgi:hypothetical protein